MINQTRTFLLNRSAIYFSGVTGSEYISPAFAPVVLSTSLARLRGVLFPQGVDKFTENYLAARILHILHMPELLAYTLYPDTRITYDLSQDTTGKLTGAPVNMTSTLVGSDVVPNYQVNSDNYPQNMAYAGEHTWVCTKVGATQLRVVHNGTTSEVFGIVGSGTRSKQIELLPQYLYAYFTMPTQQLTGQVSVTYSTKIAIPFNIGEKFDELLRSAYQDGALETLFSSTPGYDAQLADLRNTLNSSPETTLRFGALVLAYVYNCISLYKGQLNG